MPMLTRKTPTLGASQKAPKAKPTGKRHDALRLFLYFIILLHCHAPTLDENEEPPYPNHGALLADDSRSLKK